MYKLTKLSSGNYDARGYSNEESIANLQLTSPVEINAFLTYNFGMDDDRFPLTFMTEGQGRNGVVDVETVQWKWSTMNRLDFTDCVTYFNTANTKPGLGGAEFEVHFKTHKFIEQFGLVAPDGKTTVRIQKDLGESPYGYGYILRLTTPDPTVYIDPSYLEVGKYWSLSAPTVSESYSKGNRSNSMGPGKMTSQLEFHRYSKEVAGNISNVVTKYQFKGANGGINNLWISEEMRQFNIMMRVMNEERLWIAEYNRNVNGEIPLKDRDNNKPIPHTAGMFEIAGDNNYDEYGEFLTIGKLNRTIGDVIDRDTDTGLMDIVLLAGKGFIEDFDNAMKRDAKDNGFLTPLGDKEIMGNGSNLEYGAYFRKYHTVEGHTVTVKHCSFFDTSTIAEAAKKNGNIHPRTGYPMTSHQAIFADFSSYDGHQNIRLVRQKGQIYKAKVFKGMTDVPASWGVPESNYISTDVDMSRYEVKTSIGLQVNKSSKMFHLKCVL